MRSMDSRIYQFFAGPAVIFSKISRCNLNVAHNKSSNKEVDNVAE